MLVRSCFLVTLIKCLKGHKSPGSLCNVKSKSTVSESVTRSPIELLWTAKNQLVIARSLKEAGKRYNGNKRNINASVQKCTKAKLERRINRKKTIGKGEKVF